MSVLAEAVVADEFRHASRVLFSDSALYRELSLRIADDPDLIAIAARARPGQSPVLLLFAAVHFDTLRGVDHELTGVYRDLRSSEIESERVWPLFLDYCRQGASSVSSFVAGSRVQTNELGRSLLLRLGVEWAAERLQPQRISWLELAASAGLNLTWDQFQMEFSRGSRRWQRGESESPIRLDCRFEGSETPVERRTVLPRVVERLGVDIAPVDLRAHDGPERLQAFVWADHWERLERLRRAIELFCQSAHSVRFGDATQDLVRMCRDLRPDTTLCIGHTFLVSQLTENDRAALNEQLERVSLDRELVRIFAEWEGEGTQLGVEHWRGGRRAERRTLAHCHPHGHVVSWCA